MSASDSTRSTSAHGDFAHCAAVLVDYQNLYYYLKNRLQYPASPGDNAAAMIETLRRRLAAEGTRIARGCAYADFGGLDEHVRHVQRSLYLHGIQPHFVPSTMHRNTTDLQLALDACALRDEHPEIDTVILMCGDRDYVPVVNALQAGGKRVVMVAFREHLSAHLLANTGSGFFLDAALLLSDEARRLLSDDERESGPEETTQFGEVKDVPYDRDYDALEVIERFFGQYEEIYLTPLLRRLSEELGDLEDHDPKSLIGDLEGAGAVRLERRKGMPYDYTVLLVNREHPAVIEVREDVRGDAPADDDEDDAPDDDEYEVDGDEETNDVDEAQPVAPALPEGRPVPL